MNPEQDKSRLESLLCVLLKKNVRILTVPPNDSTRIADESSLLITDMVVELEYGSISNVEIQKIGYAFSYQAIKNFYLVVIYENSPAIFHIFPDIYYHHSRQVFDSGLKLDHNTSTYCILQEFKQFYLHYLTNTIYYIVRYIYYILNKTKLFN